MLAALLWLTAAVTVAPTPVPNATTLPFQRHVVRLGEPAAGAGVLVAALQKQGADGDGLTLYRSDDQGGEWHRVGELPVDQRVRFTADLLADEDGQGFLLVYGVEPQSSQWTTDARFHVGVMHYRFQNGELVRDRGPVEVFAASSGQGWFRPSVTRDALGTLHVAATRFDGSSYGFYERRSIDAGEEWTPEERLAASSSSFIGGRVTAFGSRVAAIYDEYDARAPGRFRVAAAGPCAPWENEEVFATDGLYHAGAFAAVATPDGKLHLAYHAKGSEPMRYRVFDGLSWSSAFTFESVGWWANQPAIARHGNDVVVVWNHMRASDHMEMRARTRRADGLWNAERTIDASRSFKGYTNGLEEVLPGESMLVLWCEEQASGSEVRAAPVAP